MSVCLWVCVKLLAKRLNVTSDFGEFDDVWQQYVSIYVSHIVCLCLGGTLPVRQARMCSMPHKSCCLHFVRFHFECCCCCTPKLHEPLTFCLTFHTYYCNCCLNFSALCYSSVSSVFVKCCTALTFIARTNYSTVAQHYWHSSQVGDTIDNWVTNYRRHIQIIVSSKKITVQLRPFCFS